MGNLNVRDPLQFDHGTRPVCARVQVPDTMAAALATESSSYGGAKQASCVAHGNFVNADITISPPSPPCTRSPSPCSIRIQTNISMECSPCCSPSRAHGGCADEPVSVAPAVSQTAGVSSGNTVHNAHSARRTDTSSAAHARAPPAGGGSHPIGDTNAVQSRRNASGARAYGEGSPCMQQGAISVVEQNPGLVRHGNSVISGAGRLQPACNSHQSWQMLQAAVQGCPSQRSEIQPTQRAGLTSADAQRAHSAVPLAPHAWNSRRAQPSGKVSASVLCIARRIMREASSSDDDVQPDDEHVSAAGPSGERPQVRKHGQPHGSEERNSSRGETLPLNRRCDVHASSLCAVCRSPVDISIKQTTASGSPKRQSPTQQRHNSPPKSNRSPRTKARAERVERVSSTLHGLKDRSRKVCT